jgi:hypothetical protein
VVDIVMILINVYAKFFLNNRDIDEYSEDDLYGNEYERKKRSGNGSEFQNNLNYCLCA